MVSAIPPFGRETGRWSGDGRRPSPAGLGVPMSLGKARANSAGANKSYLHREPLAYLFAPTARAAVRPAVGRDSEVCPDLWSDTVEVAK